MQINIFVAYIYLIAWVSGQYGEILHECTKYCPEPKARDNTAHECNVSPYWPLTQGFIIHFFDHWRLTTISYIIQRTSEHSETGRYPCAHIVSASRSRCGVRRLSYSWIVYAKHCSHGSEKRLGWRASGNRSGITSTAFHGHSLLSWTLLTAELTIVYDRFQRSYLSKLSEDQLCRAIRGAVSVHA